jgi:hypothetical protein
MKQFGFVLVLQLLFTMFFPVPAFGQEERPIQSTDLTTEILSVGTGSAAEIAGLLHDVYPGGSGTVVFAVPMTNLLFVKATKEDLFNIKELIRPL